MELLSCLPRTWSALDLHHFSSLSCFYSLWFLRGGVVGFFYSTKAIFTVFVRILTHFQRQCKLGALRLRFCGRRSWHQRQREPFLLFSSSAPSVYSIYLQLFTPGVAPQLCHCYFLLGFRWTVWPQLNLKYVQYFFKRNSLARLVVSCVSVSSSNKATHTNRSAGLRDQDRKREPYWPVLPPRNVSWNCDLKHSQVSGPTQSSQALCLRHSLLLSEWLEIIWDQTVLSGAFLTPSQNCREGEWVFKDGAWLIIRFSF